MILRDKGHVVIEHTWHNDELDKMSAPMQAWVTIWNSKVYRELRILLREKQPDVVHVDNTFPYASPAVLRAVKAEKVPLVMSLRNYRLLCANALLFREGRICEACVGRVPWRSVVHACYRESRLASAAVTTMLGVHRTLGTWKLVDQFIALTGFARERFIEAGFSPEKIQVKPNFVHPDPGVGSGGGKFALFVGRLSEEKGIRTLIRAWELLDGDFPLKIVGDGPLATEVRRAAERVAGVEWLGRKRPREVYELMGEADFLVFPSEWYEPFGRVAIEAFAKGTPVVAAKIAGVGEVTDHGRTGLHFRPGDPEDLAAKVEWLIDHPEELARMRKEARAEFEAKYTAEKNYEMLMEIYGRTIEAVRRK